MFADCRLGLKPHSSNRVGRHLRMTEEYVDEFMSRTPTDWALGRPWDSDDLGNKVKSNCGPVAWINWLKMMLVAAGREREAAQFTITDADDFYRACGWDGTEAGDDGVVALDMMFQTMRHPVRGLKADGFLCIGHNDETHLATAIQHAPLIVGEDLTQACKGDDHWTGMDAQSPLWGPHAVLAFSYSPGGTQTKTWGRAVFQDQTFRWPQWNEAYLPICFELMPHLDTDRLAALGRLL